MQHARQRQPREVPLCARSATCGAPLMGWITTSSRGERETDPIREVANNCDPHTHHPPTLLLRHHHLPSRRLPSAASSRLNKLPRAEGGTEGLHIRARPEGIYFLRKSQIQTGEDSSADASATIEALRHILLPPPPAVASSSSPDEYFSRRETDDLMR